MEGRHLFVILAPDAVKIKEYKAKNAANEKADDKNKGAEPKEAANEANPAKEADAKKAES